MPSKDVILDWEAVTPGLSVNIKEGETGRFRCFVVLEVNENSLVASFIRHDGETDELVLSAPRSFDRGDIIVGELSPAATKSGRWKVSKTLVNKVLKEYHATAAPASEESEVA